MPNGYKLCHIVKRPDFDGYGFNLHSEKIKPGQYIGKVDANSPASLGGLKEGDRILEVNGVPIGNETHKQVVQRIKAIANEVRLLLIDADAAINGYNNASTNTTATTPTKPSTQKTPITVGSTAAIVGRKHINNAECYGTVQEMPGASANISTISMVSTKRMSNSINGGQSSPAVSVPVMPPIVPLGEDATDRGYAKNGGLNGNVIASEQSGTNNINNNNSKDVNTPLPPSAAVASLPKTTSTLLSSPSSTSMSNSGSGNKAGSLQLPMTAAEMRAKLMSKKKYDPKNESVDLKKKFEIIQKL